VKGYKANIEELTLANSYFRQVLYTSKNFQLVIMVLRPNEEIGFEIHNENDQFFRFEKGEGRVVIDDINYDVNDGDCVIVPLGARHNVINFTQFTVLPITWIKQFTRQKKRLCLLMKNLMVLLLSKIVI